MSGLSDWEIIAISVGGAVGLGVIIFGCVWWFYFRTKRRDYMPITDVTVDNQTSMDFTHRGNQRKDDVLDPDAEKKRQEIASKYKAEQHEALVQARLFIRSTAFSNPQLQEAIGSRKLKYYFLADTQVPTSKAMMAINPISPRSTIFSSDSSANSICKFLNSIKHPYILNVLGMDLQKEKNSFVSYYLYSDTGSLRDMIYGSRPLEKYQNKYVSVTKGQPLQDRKIKLFGRQILEALDFLGSQGVPYFQLNSSNVIVDKGVCKITDIHNDFIQQPPRMHHLLHRHIEKIDPVVASFGYLLFEMSVGFEMENHDLHSYDLGNKVIPEARQILKKIFKPEEGSISLNVRSLIQLPFFSDVALYNDWERKQLEINSKVKRLLESTIAVMMETLRADPRNRASTAPSTLSNSQTGKKKKKRSETTTATTSIPAPTSTTTSTTTTTNSTIPTIPPPPSSNNTISRTSSVAPPPAPVAPPPPPAAGIPPPPPPMSASMPAPSTGRSQLLNSITGFKGGLKKAKTNDRSSAKFTK